LTLWQLYNREHFREDTLSEKPKNPLHNDDSVWKRQLLAEAIEDHWSDLLVGIQIYVKRFGLAEDRSSIEKLSQEVLQDTVITALQSSGNYDPSRPARPWLLGVALNQIRRLRRTQYRERRYITPVADTPQVQVLQQSDHGELTEDEMFALLCQSAEQPGPHSRLTLDEILCLVKESDKQILKLAFVGGLRGKSLAAELGISEGAAYVRLSRSVARLREAYLQSERELDEEKQDAEA
jgi:RNA polymerase sigma factor (sigma-70 family)